MENMTYSFILNMGVSIIFYLSIFTFTAGTFYYIYVFAKTPAPLKIPQTPQAPQLSGVVRRMIGDVLWFRSLAKGNKSLWITGLIFHWSLAIILFFHLFGFVTFLLKYFGYAAVEQSLIDSLGKIATIVGFIFLTAIAVIIVMKALDNKSQFFSSYFDYILLFLLFAIGTTGMLMRYEPFRPDIDNIK